MKYKLTYLGPSGRFVDPTTELVWEVGDTHEVDEETVKRLNPEYTAYIEHRYGKTFVTPDDSKAQWEMEEVKSSIRSRITKPKDDNYEEDVTPDPAVAEFGGND